MSINFKSIFKVIFVIGVLLGFASVFLDWYYLQGIADSGETVVFWIYNALFDWSTTCSTGALFNESYQPNRNRVSSRFVLISLFSTISRRRTRRQARKSQKV